MTRSRCAGPVPVDKAGSPLLGLDDLLAFGSPDAYHFDPETQQFLSSLLAAVAIIDADHRRNDSGVGELLLEHRNKVRAVGRVAPGQHQRGDKATLLLQQPGVLIFAAADQTPQHQEKIDDIGFGAGSAYLQIDVIQFKLAQLNLQFRQKQRP